MDRLPGKRYCYFDHFCAIQPMSVWTQEDLANKKEIPLERYNPLWNHLKNYVQENPNCGHFQPLSVLGRCPAEEEQEPERFVCPMEGQPPPGETQLLYQKIQVFFITLN